MPLTLRRRRLCKSYYVARPLALDWAKAGTSSIRLANGEIYSAPGSANWTFLLGLLGYFSVNCLKADDVLVSFSFPYIHISFYMPLVDHSVNHHWEIKGSSMSTA